MKTRKNQGFFGKVLSSTELREFADDNFKFNENGNKFFKRVENTVGKEEISCNNQFLIFSQYFQDLYCRHREYLYSAVVYQKYLTRFRELIIFEP